jgi:hypothetical protein
MKLLTWDDASPIVYHYFNFWEDGEDLLWFKQCFPSLERHGLMSFFSEEEEMVVRGRITMLALFYGECIERVFHDGPRLSEENFKEIFDVERDVIEEELIKMVSALVEDIGLLEITKLTLASLLRGYGNNLPLGDFLALLQKTMDNLPDYTNWREDRVFSLFNGSSLHPNEMECLPFIPNK